MAFLDISIVNVALNDIRANFGTPLDRIAWVSTAYAMANITIIPMSGWLLKRFGYTAATALNFLVGTAIFAGSLLLSLYCGTVMHYRALDIGRVFLLGSWIQLFIFPLAGRLVTRVNPRLLLVIANTGIFTSLWLNAHLTADASMGNIVRPLFIRAIGTGFGFVPLTFLAVASVDTRSAH